MQKVYVSHEEKEKMMDKLIRDIEVRMWRRRSRDAMFFLTLFVRVCLLSVVFGAYEDHGL